MQLSGKYTRVLTFENVLLGYDPRERILSRHRSRELIAERAGRAVLVNHTDDQLLQLAQHSQEAPPGARAGGRGGRGAGADHESDRPPPLCSPTPPHPTSGGGPPPGSGVVGCGGDRGGVGGGNRIGQATVDMSEPFACGSFKARIPKSTVTVTFMWYRF